jgi:hypothetical protein
MHHFIIRQDACGLDAFWLKKGSVKPSDIDGTDTSSEQFGDLYQSMRDKVKDLFSLAELRELTNQGDRKFVHALSAKRILRKSHPMPSV